VLRPRDEAQRGQATAVVGLRRKVFHVPATRPPKPLVLYDKDGEVAVVSLNRPERLNAYDVAMRDALYEVLLAVRDDPEVRAVVLRGEGPAFSTGGDVSEFGAAPSPLVAREVRWKRDVWGVLQKLRPPTIAAVHGYAVGGGWEMAMLCDLCIAGDDARFSFPETGMGMIPGVAGTQTAPRAAGVGRALDWVLTGRWLSAAQALQAGVVARVVRRGALDAEAMRLARRLAALDPRLVTAVKRAVREGLELPLVGGLALEHRLAVRAARS